MNKTFNDVALMGKCEVCVASQLLWLWYPRCWDLVAVLIAKNAMMRVLSPIL